MNPSLALGKRGGYFLPTLGNECVRHTCWQASFSVYKYQSTCSHSSGNRARLPAADEAQFHQLIATGAAAPCVLLYIWLYSTVNFSIQCTHSRWWLAGCSWKESWAPMLHMLQEPHVLFVDNFCLLFSVMHWSPLGTQHIAVSLLCLSYKQKRSLME